MSDLESVIRDFVNDNEELFDCIWRRNDSPTEQEMDAIADTWYDEYGEIPDWEEVEDKVMRLAEVIIWSNQVFALTNDEPYVEGDILFDSTREDYLSGED